MSEQPLGILIVEDEALLAMDIAAVVEAADHAVVGEAASLAEVAALSESLHADCALVDIQLLHGSSGVDAACLLRQFYPEICILFVTANTRSVPAGFDGAIGILEKPFTRAGLGLAIGYMAERAAGAAAPAWPSSLVPIRPADDV